VPRSTPHRSVSLGSVLAELDQRAVEWVVELAAKLSCCSARRHEPGVDRQRELAERWDRFKVGLCDRARVHEGFDEDPFIARVSSPRPTHLGCSVGEHMRYGMYIDIAEVDEPYAFLIFNDLRSVPDARRGG